MAIVIENGAGIPGAQSYVSTSYVDNYLSNRGRSAENGWSDLASSAKEHAVVTATQYIDTRWGGRFKGTKKHQLNGDYARALVAAGGQPDVNDTITVGATTYTFVSTAVSFNRNQVIIGANLAATIDNLVVAISQKGEVFATEYVDAADTILLYAPENGYSYNDTALSVAATGWTIQAAWQGGSDAGSQPLEFPRRDLVDKAGRMVVGIPINLKEATAEYAVRSVNATLYADPARDENGRILVEAHEVVGPIEQRVRYSEGGNQDGLLQAYPAADRLIWDYLKPAGVYR